MTDRQNKSKKPLADQTTDHSRGGDYSYIESVQAKPLEVKVYDSFEKAMKHFRALVQKERVLSTFKEKQRYEKKSDKKRRKRAENQRKRLELEAKQTNDRPRKEKVRELKDRDPNDTE
jgi:ribosomal protein S21